MSNKIELHYAKYDSINDNYTYNILTSDEPFHILSVSALLNNNIIYYVTDIVDDIMSIYSDSFTLIDKYNINYFKLTNCHIYNDNIYYNFNNSLIIGVYIYKSSYNTTNISYKNLILFDAEIFFQKIFYKFNDYENNFPILINNLNIDMLYLNNIELKDEHIILYISNIIDVNPCDNYYIIIHYIDICNELHIN